MTTRREFVKDFPDLAPAAANLENNPFPASFAVRLNPQAQSATGAIDNMVTTFSGVAGVADVRYDRTWIARLNAVIRVIRGVGLVIVLLMAVASALTVANVVRLTAMARGAENTQDRERASAGFRVGAQKNRREEELLNQS